MVWSTREQMKEKLAHWPVKGRIVCVTVTMDPDLLKEVPMLIDEHGNYWVHDQCLNRPPNLPMSWRDFRANMQALMRDAGLAPEILTKYEDLYPKG